MAVKIRLRRMGRKKSPIYGLVAADERSPRDGRFIEDLGRYNPTLEPTKVSIKQDRVLYWLEQGAQPTETARSILSKQGVMLALHMRRKGAAEDAILAAVEEHRARHEELATKSVKTTVQDRVSEALAAEVVAAKKAEEEYLKVKAAADAKLREQAEVAKKKLEAQVAAQREAAAAVAKEVQAESNLAQAAVDSAAVAGAAVVAKPDAKAKPQAKAKPAPEPKVEAAPEPAVEAAPEPEVEVAAEPVGEATPEPVVEAAPEASADASSKEKGEASSADDSKTKAEEA